MSDSALAICMGLAAGLGAGQATQPAVDPLRIVAPADGGTTESYLTAILRWQYTIRVDGQPIINVRLRVSTRPDLAEPIVDVDLKDHQTSRFALRGSHSAVPCQDCHKKGDSVDAVTAYHFASLAYEACHKDPHRGEFPAVLISSASATQSVCESCHGLISWRQLKPFDHSVTDFALTGGHASVTCAACHMSHNQGQQAAAVPFKTSDKCEGCHEDIHGGQFQRLGIVDCAGCHTTSRWPVTGFDHETRTTFSLQGAHQNVPCRLCHNDRREINGRIVIVYKDAPRECNQCHRKQ